MNAEDALRSLPATIRKTENDTFARKQQLEGLRLKLKLREADIGQAIAKENAETKAYPNADARESELRKRLEHDPEARALKKDVVEEEALIVRMASTLSYYENVQRNARVLLLARSPATIVFEDEEMPR